MLVDPVAHFIVEFQGLVDRLNQRRRNARAGFLQRLELEEAAVQKALALEAQEALEQALGQ